MTAPDASGHWLNGHNSIQTREDWDAHCAHTKPPRPALLTREAYAALSDAARETYDLSRDAWHSDFGTGTTPALVQAMKRFGLITRLNWNSNDPVKAHVAVSGPPNQGKTTIVRNLGRDYVKRLRRLLRQRSITPHPEFCPVVYYTLESESTTRSLNTGVLHYLGVPMRSMRSYTNAQLSQATAEALVRCGVLLLILDDMHLLKRGHSNTEGIRDYLKALTSKAPIMLLIAGIDLEKTDLFEETKSKTGVKAGQTGGRTSLIQVTRFSKGSKAWGQLITWTEQKLVLIDHEPGVLVALQAYLWNRTQGSIGSLMTLLRLAALSVTGQEGERVNRKVLDQIRIDHNAEGAGNRTDL